jgi:hypothetical protein
MWHNQVVTSVILIQQFSHMWVTNQSDTWQYLTLVKPRVTLAEASAIETVHLRDRCQRSRRRRHIGHREIGVLEVEGNKTSKVSKSQRNRDHPSGRTRGMRSVPSGRGSTEKSLIDILFIGKSGIPLTRLLCKSESRSAKPR